MTDVAIADASDLSATIARARELLDDGDVRAALLLAGGAYDQAKAAAQFAERAGAAERLIGKARRLQGDALLIESRARMRLANEYDAAVAAGVVAPRGRPKKNNSAENVLPTMSDIGVSAAEISVARSMAVRERDDPGFLERAIAVRVEAGLEPSRANLRAAIGTDTRTKAERGDNLYETPIEAMRTLLALERFESHVLEPWCGKGAIVRPLEAAGYRVTASDLVDRGAVPGQGVSDFMDLDLELPAAVMRRELPRPDIVSNPPYGDVLNAHVARALKVFRPRRMALLLNLNFLCGSDNEDRNFAMDEAPPRRVYVFSRRLPMMHQDGWEGNIASSRMNTAWFVWERAVDGSNRNYRGPTVTRRVDWKDFQGEAPLKPYGGDDET